MLKKNNKENDKTIISNISTLAVLIIVIGSVFVANGLIFGASSPPACSPPDCNVPAPLNVGLDGQEKEGGLILNTGGADDGLIVDNGNVGIGTRDPRGDIQITDKMILTDNQTGGQSITNNAYYFGSEWYRLTNGSANMFSMWDNTAFSFYRTSSALANQQIAWIESMKLDVSGLHVDGNISADAYCDGNGGNCESITNLSGGGGGIGVLNLKVRVIDCGTNGCADEGSPNQICLTYFGGSFKTLSVDCEQIDWSATSANFDSNLWCGDTGSGDVAITCYDTGIPCAPTITCDGLAGHQCGPVNDGCGIFLDCGVCSGYDSCYSGTCDCYPSCNNTCSGPDGCGGYCAASDCEDGYSCNSGTCIED
ncbi:MAG: hypothetical protein V1829_00080 [bacterium]